MARTTMEDIARAAGVSRALVSIAYRNADGVSAATREHILTIGEELGYVHNRVAANLATRGSRSIGVYLQDLHNEFFADVYDGIREVAEDHDRELVLAIGRRERDSDAAPLTTLQGARVGIIVAAGLRLSDETALLHNRRVPLVSLARDIPGIDSVYSDNRRGAELATSHLLELGHRRIAFFANPPSDGYLDRARGYEARMLEAGLDPRTIETSYSRGEVAAIAGDVLASADAPTAVFAHNDRAALGVLDAIAAAGLAPGRDISVIGYDNSSAGSAPGTDLTSVDLHGVELGRQATELALRRHSRPDLERQFVRMQPTLVVRSTTGPAPHRLPRRA